jgi:integrase
VAVSKRIRHRAVSGSHDARPEPDAPEIAPVRAMATLAEFVTPWLATRDNRTRQADAQRIRDHFLPLLGRRRLREIRAADVSDVVRQVLGKKGINVKSVRNAYAVFAALLGDALAQGLLAEDPRVLPDDIWPVEVTAPRPSFSPAEVRALTSDERLDADLRIYNSLAFHTGLPARELGLLRFGDWSKHLSAPASPELEGTLARWREAGFESVYGRAPTSEDWLVPRRSDPTQPHTEGSAYKAFRRACVALGIKPRSLHAIHGMAKPAPAGGAAGPAAAPGTVEAASAVVADDDA